jgi:1-deoxy-D-xylulose 5-phosphate reductoisomerase
MKLEILEKHILPKLLQEKMENVISPRSIVDTMIKKVFTEKISDSEASLVKYVGHIKIILMTQTLLEIKTLNNIQFIL